MVLTERLSDLEDLVYAAREDLEKFESAGNAAAGTRARKVMFDVKAAAQEIRLGISEIKNQNKNMEVQILVTVQIDFDDGTPDFEPGDPGEDRMRESAKEAVENALELVEGSGFSHDMACIASVGIVDCEIFLPNAKVHTPLPATTSDETEVKP
jgi:hypothetical protein